MLRADQHPAMFRQHRTHPPHQVGPWSVYRVSLTQRPSRARLSLECGNQSLNFMPKRQPREP